MVRYMMYSQNLACLEAQKFVEAFKKHVKVAQSLMPGCT